MKFYSTLLSYFYIAPNELKIQDRTKQKKAAPTFLFVAEYVSVRGLQNVDLVYHFYQPKTQKDKK